MLFVLACCLVAENSWFVKHRMPGMTDVTYREIAQTFGLPRCSTRTTSTTGSRARSSRATIAIRSVFP